MLNITTDAWEQLYEAGLAHHAAGRLREAESSWRQVLAQNPLHASATIALGVLYIQVNRTDEAIALLREAAGQYADVSVLCHLGIALHIRGHLEGAGGGGGGSGGGSGGGAVEALQRSLTLGESAVAHFHLGAIFITLNRLPEAIGHLQRAVALSPDHSDAWRTLSMALQLEGRISEGLEAIRRAVACAASAENYSILGSAQASAGRVPQAVESFRKAVVAGGGDAAAGRAGGRGGDAGGGAIHSAMLLVMHYQAVLDPPALFGEHRRWNEVHAKTLAKGIAPHANDRSPDRRLRVGYVSPDLRNHPVGRFIEPILAHHDRKVVEVYGYYAGSVTDALTERLRSSADQWRSITFLNDDAAAAMIRKDQIDILLDLSGHTTANRLGIFARKPAPLQVTYLGYPDTTGLEVMDYRLTDGIADPPGLTDHLHSEKLLRLGGGPECFLCFGPPENAPLVGPAPSKTNGFITFGSFNLLPKITPAVIAVWSEILRKIPTARLLLKSSALGDAGVRQALLDQFQDQGIAAARLDLRGRVDSYMDHLDLYNRVDIGLDTFPYHGTMTTCEALFMGVPVITLAGQTHVSRVGASILSTLNLSALSLPDLIAATPDQYVDIAVRLANDAFRRGKFRSVLRQRMLGSTLMDAPRFTASLERAYREIWRKWCAAE